MIFTAHLLLGILIGKSLDNFLLIGALAFFSHFLLDAIPHLDQGSFKRARSEFTSRDWFLVFLDIVIGLLFLFFFSFKFPFLPIFIGAVFAVLPDILNNFIVISHSQKKPFFKHLHNFHEAVGFKLTRELVWLGILAEAVVIVTVLALLLSV